MLQQYAGFGLIVFEAASIKPAVWILHAAPSRNVLFKLRVRQRRHQEIHHAVVEALEGVRRWHDHIDVEQVEPLEIPQVHRGDDAMDEDDTMVETESLHPYMR